MESLRSRTSLYIVLGLSTGLVVLLIFHAGVAYGERRGHPRDRMTPSSSFLPHSFIPGGHGAVGTIATVTPPTFTLTTREGEVETILIGSTTLLRSEQTPMRIEDLHPGQNVVVLGDPHGETEGIQARLIRILPPPR